MIELAAAAVIVLAGMLFLAWSNLNRSLRTPTTAYCDNHHPALQPRVTHLGGMRWACACPRCHDRAIITAAGPDTARRQYSAHPCAAQPAPFPPQ